MPGYLPWNFSHQAGGIISRILQARCAAISRLLLAHQKVVQQLSIVALSYYLARIESLFQECYYLFTDVYM